jgi:phosphatidylserine decarboxylase
MAKEGFPFVLIPAIIALILAYLQLWWIAAIFVALAAFMAFFFRDPFRQAPDEANIIVSAADGKVTRIDRHEDNSTTVSVFLSPLDVHINRSPIAGIIERVQYVKGKKAPATGNDASFINERNSLTIKGEKITVVVTQIAGIVARRIVCWYGEGDELEIGERFGLIKFSSRTDVQMPSTVEVLAKIGDRVKGGETIIGRVRE